MGVWQGCPWTPKSVTLARYARPFYALRAGGLRPYSTLVDAPRCTPMASGAKRNVDDFLCPLEVYR
jgi:hypothetical protein